MPDRPRRGKSRGVAPAFRRTHHRIIAARHGRRKLEPGLALAERAYGAAVVRELKAALAQVAARRGHLAHCARALGIDDLRTMKRGISTLRALARARS